MFEFHDKWSDPKNAHRILEEPWVGITTFIEKDKVSLLEVQMRRPEGPERAEDEKPGKPAPAILRWSEILGRE